MTEEQRTKQHLLDLDERAYSRGYAVFSEFLNLNEISALKSVKTKSDYLLFGGYEGAERCVSGFGGDIDKNGFPIKCVKLSPLSSRFSDELTHRDFLGALMNLGINRNTLGDIKIVDRTGYLFCLDGISGYIAENLTRVKHTSVRAEVITDIPDFIIELPDLTELTVPSLRADAVIAAVYRLSRNNASRIFSEDGIFINSRLCSKESALLSGGDAVSVRGRGKFIFEEEKRRTKKDRIVISVRIYK